MPAHRPDLAAIAARATNAEFMGRSCADVRALLAELTAADQVNEDAVALAGQLTAEANAMRVEIDRLRRLLDTRDGDYALVVRVGYDGRAQVDGRAGISMDQIATWTRELADDTARRANQ